MRDAADARMATREMRGNLFDSLTATRLLLKIVYAIEHVSSVLAVHLDAGETAGITTTVRRVPGCFGLRHVHAAQRDSGACSWCRHKHGRNPSDQ
jgi:hypothetical protein